MKLLREGKAKNTDCVIFAANVDSAKQIAAEIVYDPAVFGNFTFGGGNLVTGALILPAGGVPEPEIREDGLASVSASGTKLSGRGLSAGETPKRVFVVTYDIIGSIPESGSFISVVSLRIGLSSSDADIKTFPLDRFGVRVRPNFANQIFNFELVPRRLNAAAVLWETRFPGINNTVRYRPVGEEVFLTAHNPLLDQATDEIVAALRLLIQQGLDPTELSNSQIRSALGVPVLPSGFAGTLRRITEALKTRRHLVLLPHLQPGGTRYQIAARSFDLEGRPTPFRRETLRTRRALDLRPMFIHGFEVQTVPTGAVMKWITNRPSDTQYSIKLDGSEVISGTADSDGTQAHIVIIERGELQAGTEYTYDITSTLLEETTLSDAEKTATRSGRFRTRRTFLPLRFLGPPHRDVGSETAVITAALSRISSLTIHYGEVDSASTQSYPDSIASTEDLNRQTLTIPGLDPATEYEYRMTAISDGDTIITDPRRHPRLSRFKTTAEGDTTLAITEGPQVVTRHNLAIFRVTSDVACFLKVIVGTLGENGTLGTSDEFELQDLAPNGRPRLRRRHVVTFPGLERFTTYGYRMELTSASGRTIFFDPNQTVSAKVAKIQQPPGGGGGAVSSPATMRTPSFPSSCRAPRCPQRPTIQRSSSGPQTNRLTARYSSARTVWTTKKPRATTNRVTS